LALGNIETCFLSLQERAGELNTNTQQITSTLINFSNRIDAIEAPKDLLSRKLAPIFEKIAEQAEQTVGRVSSERQRNQNVLKLVTRLDTVAASIENISDKITDRESQVATGIQQAVALVGQTAELTKQIGTWTQGFVNIEAKQQEALAALTRASDEAQDREREREERLRKALADGASAITEYQTRSQALLQRHSELFEAELLRAERAFNTLVVAVRDGASLLASELSSRE
jgi:chromosome segregation ATPase